MLSVAGLRSLAQGRLEEMSLPYWPLPVAHSIRSFAHGYQKALHIRWKCRAFLWVHANGVADALRVSHDLSGSHTLVFAESVQAAELVDVHMELVGNALKRLAVLHLVVEALRTVHGVVDYLVGRLAASQFATLNHVAGVTAVAHLAALACGLCRLAVVCLTVKHVLVARHILVAEVEEQGGVEGHAAQACFEVEVRTSASAGVATQSDALRGGRRWSPGRWGDE